MRCFSNTPTMIQAIGVLRGIRQQQNEQAYLYTARYEFINNRAHNIQPEEQTQVSEIIHYTHKHYYPISRGSCERSSTHFIDLNH